MALGTASVSACSGSDEPCSNNDQAGKRMVGSTSQSAHKAQKSTKLDLADIDPKQPVVSQVGQMGSGYWEWVGRPDTRQPRFFGPDLLEACSKTPWWVVPLVWLPLFTSCMLQAHTTYQVHPAVLPLWLVVGTVAWQLLEYLIHRFIFHARPTTFWGITLHFLFHGCHHKYPMDHLRLVFPPLPAAALVALVYVGLHATLPTRHALPLFAGMGFGYVVYDCLHYAMHHLGNKLPGAALQGLRRRHMHHHYKDTEHGFGISCVLFDFMCGTLAVS